MPSPLLPYSNAFLIITIYNALSLVEPHTRNTHPSTIDLTLKAICSRNMSIYTVISILSLIKDCPFYGFFRILQIYSCFKMLGANFCFK